MIEIKYRIDVLKTSMFVDEGHYFYLFTKQWIMAVDLKAGDKIQTCDGHMATIIHIKPMTAVQHHGDLRMSHNHHYFMTMDDALPTHFSGASPIAPAENETLCSSTNDAILTDPLERIPFDLANRPSKFSDGCFTGYHSGPWAAARYLDFDLPASKTVMGWGRATDTMCAEDAALYDLKHKLGGAVELHRGNVAISHAYIRKYTRKGRFVNRMSPCLYCRENYGSALNDTSLGESVLEKVDRGYLPLKP